MSSNRVREIVFSAFAVSAMLAAGRARADSPVYADLSGICGGLTPCYSTIQDAVSGASDPDGPGPDFAEVFVFPGTYAESVDLAGLNVAGFGVGDIRLVTVDATGAPAAGTARINPATGQAIWNQGSIGGRIEIDGFDVTSPNTAAVELSDVGDITIRNVVAHDAGYNVVNGMGSPVGIGLRLTSHSGEVTVQHSTIQNCHAFGILAIAEARSVTIDDVDAIGNGSDGMYLKSGKDVVIRDATSSLNVDDGAEVIANRFVFIDHCQFEQNRNGVRATAVGDVTVLSSTATSNHTNGFQVASEQGTAMLNRLTADSNGGDGIAASGLDVVLTNSSSTRSNSVAFLVSSGGKARLDGLFARGALNGVKVYAYDDVQITNVAAEESISDGIRIGANGSVVMDRITSIDSAGGVGVLVSTRKAMLTVPNVSIQNSLIANNANQGILLIKLAPDGQFVVAGSIICNNNSGTAGLVQDAHSTAVIDARGNWWGDVTGPKRPNNPAGMGDGFDPGGGEILVDPWIDQITATASEPTATLSDALTVRFQFRHSGSERFLGEGPGAIGATRPFTVTTDNGTVTSNDGTAPAVSAFITDDKGRVSVVAKAATEGPAKIELSGMCFPKRSVTVDIVAAALSPNSTPNATPASGNGSPACGAGVPAMAGLSIVALFAMQLRLRPRRFGCVK